MTRIKIKSNPYTKEILYSTFDETSKGWINIKDSDAGKSSELRETDERFFLPFRIKNIINIIKKEYYVGEMIQICFEGTQDEYAEVAAICESEDNRDKIELVRSKEFLENARFIKPDIKEVFENVEPVIDNIMKENSYVIKELNKVAKALDDIIPICVFGTYSAGKSTFINALIGVEILPSGGDPVTAKIYEISNSEQPDQAKISFKYLDEEIEISIEKDGMRVLRGKQDIDIIEKIRLAVEENENVDFYNTVRIAVDILNNYEKRDKETIELGSVISLSIPFSKKSIIGNTNNKFVIFDTPGSNSYSNQEHSKVLAEALASFSNGIPIWVTEYSDHDTMDNAKLIDDVRSINALDKRFTMIVFNKADDADLPEGGFSKEKVSDILEYKAVEQMYASGIFFVSSIMGLGSKNDGEFFDRFYRKTYRTQSPTFSDPEDIDYMCLYRYNIMPEQNKANAIESSEGLDNLIYANSGLYCIEKEIDGFGSKHAAYNKCQMVFAFLNDVIKETNERINERTKILLDARERSTQELNSKTKLLQDEMERSAKNIEENNGRKSKDDISEYVSKELKYKFDETQLASIDAEQRRRNFESNNFGVKEKEYEDAKNKLWNHIKESSQGFFKKNIIESVQNMASDITDGLKNVQSRKEEMDTAEKELDKQSSEEILKYIIDMYKTNLDEVQSRLFEHLDEYWKDKEREFKRILLLQITKSEALSASQREEISDIIQNFNVDGFKKKADSVFVRKRFLRGRLLGIRITDDEKLDIRKLTKDYNDRINKIIKEMSQQMNEDCFLQFKTWDEKLLGEINANLTEYNPELKSIAEIIRLETENIADLEEKQRMIQHSFDTIKDLMSWKSVEGE